MNTAPHLGGYVEGGDPATFYPELWEWVVKERGVKSVLDVGCGEGHAISFFRTLGVNARGVDGVPQQHPNVDVFDFTRGPYFPTEAFDLVWCCEFVEHVEARYIPNFLPAFMSAPMVLLTHADPGQGGYHHVNCQPAAYWIGVMAAIGYYLDAVLTAMAKLHAQLNANPYNHFARSGMCFLRQI